MTQGIVTIQSGREKSIRNQHPWIFSGAIAKAQNAVPGEIVTVVDHKGVFLARGYWNPKSQIQVRILTWHDEPINDSWWQRMLTRSLNARGLAHTTYQERPLAFRVVNAENDFLPGLIVDYYAGWLVLQALTLYIDNEKQRIARILADLMSVQGIYDRSDVEVRGKEGLNLVTGSLWGAEPPELIQTQNLWVNVRKGHKTGLYLDQAANHQRLQQLIETELDGQCSVLNCFSYTGAFSVNALNANGVHAVSVDSSQDALDLAEKNLRLNQVGTHGETYELVHADCFEYIRECVKKGTQFDVVILDPPKFAHTKQQIDKAARGYKDLNLNAFKIIKPGGYLMTFSCSGAISRDLFQKIVFGALADSGRQAQIVQHLSAADDHPVALTFPEGEYLKGLLLRVY